MEDKEVAVKMRRLIKELNSIIFEAVTENKLRIKISTFPISQIGTKEQIYMVESYIYKEVV